MITRDQFFIIFATVMVLIIAVAFYIQRSARNRRKALQTLRRQKKDPRTRMYGAYTVFSKNPLTKRYFGKIRSRLRTIYPADDITINMQATRIMVRSAILAVLAILFIGFFAKNDMIFMLLGLTVVYLLFSVKNDREMKKIETKLLLQFSEFVDSVRENYNRSGRVDDAVGDTLDTLPFEISLHAERIHSVLTSTHVIEDAAEYADISPNQFLTTFVEIASTTMEYGDKKMEHGESLFLRNLNFLKEEVNNELLRRQTNSSRFLGLSTIAIAPVFFVKAISSYWVKNLPDIASYYNGAYGTITMALIFAFCITCYRAIEYLKEGGRSVEVKEEGISRTIANFPIVKRFIYGRIAKNYSAAVRQEEMLRFTGDHLGINSFIVRRFLTSILLVIGTTLLLITSVARDRRQVLNDFSQAFQSSVVQDADYRSDMERAAVKLMSENETLRSGKATAEDKAALAQTIQDTTNVKTRRYAEMVADTLISRSISLKDIYFKWYYLFAIIAACVIGYYIPYWIVLFKQSAVRTDMEDEVSQFRTIILMLMHVDGVNTSMVMEWMERFAFCFKSSIDECLYEMPHQGQKALEKMRDRESFPAFQSFTNNLINVDNVGIAQAFSGVEIDREYYRQKRKEDNEIAIKWKSTVAMFMSFIPLFFILFAYFIAPVAQYANDQMNLFTSI